MVLTADFVQPVSGSEQHLAAEIHGLIGELDRQAAHFGPYHSLTIAAAHRLAVAVWRTGDIDRAIGILDQALNGIASWPQPDRFVRAGILSTLAEILVENGHLERAADIYREALEICIRQLGDTHPSSLAAKGDLASVLFELGETKEASYLEAQAYDGARCHLGSAHPVTCVLAWNRCLRFEAAGKADTVRSIVTEELAWLLTHEGEPLSADQQMIRTMLARRLNWDSAGVC
jgi:tetratricopeptide (TPR) repeat protein